MLYKDPVRENKLAIQSSPMRNHLAAVGNKKLPFNRKKQNQAQEGLALYHSQIN